MSLSNIYLLIFLPLVSSLFCQIFYKKKLPFFIALFSSILVFLLALKISFDVFVYEKIANDFELSLLSIGLEFRLDLLGIIFILLLVFLKIVILVFYYPDIEKFLDEKNRRIFYSVFLLHLFSLIGIFTTNNLLNLFLFLEIYSFSFFANLSISRDSDLLKLSFRYFSLNAASSLLILFCFLMVYLTFGEVNFDKISANFSLASAKYSWFLAIIFGLLMFAFIIKFFPFPLYFEKLKSTSLIANFLGIDSLFIKTNVGIFLVLKFIYFFFGNQLIFKNFDFSFTLIFLSILLIFYSAIKLYQQKHLKFIAAYFCLNNLGFILACVALQKIESLQAMFFYLLNFSLVNLLIFIFGSFLKRYFDSSSINKIWLIRKHHFLLVLPLKILVLFIAAFPLTILFSANWYLAYASFSLGFEAFLLIALIVSSFAQINLALKLISSFFMPKIDESMLETFDKKMPVLGLKKYQFYLLSFWFLILIIGVTSFASGLSADLSLRFASFLLSNSVY
jgi:formate hydrogenlyase subunit 3/multisubunit Na+/H+ antiporter MnhD subunit